MNVTGSTPSGHRALDEALRRADSAARRAAESEAKRLAEHRARVEAEREAGRLAEQARHEAEAGASALALRNRQRAELNRRQQEAADRAARLGRAYQSHSDEPRIASAEGSGPGGLGDSSLSSSPLNEGETPVGEKPSASVKRRWIELGLFVLVAGGLVGMWVGVWAPFNSGTRVTGGAMDRVDPVTLAGTSETVEPTLAFVEGERLLGRSVLDGRVADRERGGASRGLEKASVGFESVESLTYGPLDRADPEPVQRPSDLSSTPLTPEPGQLLAAPSAEAAFASLKISDPVATVAPLPSETLADVSQQEKHIDVSPVSVVPDEQQVAATPAAVVVPGRRLALLVDASGSTVDTMPRMARFIGDWLDDLEPGDRFTIIYFREGEAIEAVEPGLKDTSPASIRQTWDWVAPREERVMASGRSDVLVALRLTLTYRVQHITILSDDTFGGRKTPTEEVVAAMSEVVSKRSVTIDTVGFFYEDDDGTLVSVADRFGGEYRFIEPEQVEEGGGFQLP